MGKEQDLISFEEAAKWCNRECSNILSPHYHITQTFAAGRPWQLVRRHRYPRPAAWRERHLEGKGVALLLAHLPDPRQKSYKSGSGCIEYCTEDSQLRGIMADCKPGPAPAPTPPRSKSYSHVYVPGLRPTDAPLLC